MIGAEPKAPRTDVRGFFARRRQTTDTRLAAVATPPAPAAPEPAPEPEPHEAEFKDTPAFRVLSHLGCLDLKADSSGKTVKEDRKYIRATLPDEKGGVEMEAVYRIDGITNTRVTMSYVHVGSDGKKTVVSSSRGDTDGLFWNARVFKVSSKADFDKGVKD